MMTQQEQGEDVGNALQRFLAAGSVDVPFDDGVQVRIVFTALPGRTACVAACRHGVLWIAADDAVPWVRGHVAEMLADGLLEWRENYFQVTAMRRIPTQGVRGCCRLALVP